LCQQSAIAYCALLAIGWQSEKGELVTAFSRLITDWMPLCMSNAMAFSSLLLSAEVGLRAALGEYPWSSCAVTLSMNCISLLRKEIDNPSGDVSDTMIATVVNMAAAELVFVRDPITFENHRRGLRQMVKLRGGVDKLTGILKGMVLWATQLDDALKINTQDVNDEANGTAGVQEEAPSTALTTHADELSSRSYDEILESARSLQPREFFAVAS